MSWPFKNGYNNAEGCACHGETFCPDYICVGYYENDVPIFMHKNVVAQIKKEQEKNLIPNTVKQLSEDGFRV